jgi:hypothetical protein
MPLARLTQDLFGTSRLIFDDGSYPIICPDSGYLCDGLVALFPAKYPDPTWPILPVYLNILPLVSMKYVLITHFLFQMYTANIISTKSLPNYTIERDPNKYVVAMIFNYDIDGQVGTYLEESAMAHARLEFLNMVVNANGEVFDYINTKRPINHLFSCFLKPLTGDYPLTPGIPECDYSAFQSILAQITSTISLLNDPNEDQNTLQYQVMAHNSLTS